jgi:hypothetical protein
MIGCAIKAPRQPLRDRLACLPPQRRGVGEMGIERMRQAHLIVRKFMEVAIGKDRCLDIREQPIFDVRADRLDCVERKR